MRFSFIIPTVKQFDLLFKECIDSLFQFHPDDDFEVIIVDDGSPKILQDRIEAECKRRNLRYHLSPINQGFSKTVNIGLSMAKGEICILVNNDIKFIQNITEALDKSFKEDPKIGIIGALLFYPDGAIQHAGMKALSYTHYTHMGWHKKPSEVSHLLNNKFTISVTGALFAINKQCINEIGLFKETYFLSCEDTEYCLRAWTKGWKVFFNSNVKAIHLEGHTRGNSDQIKTKDHPTWFAKEKKTINLFEEDIKNIYIQKWDVIKANIASSNGKPPQVTSPSSHINRVKTGHKAVTQPFIIRRMGALGDVILLTGPIRAFKEAHKDADIIVVTHFPEVFQNNPNVLFATQDSTMGNPSFDLDNEYEKYPKSHIARSYSKKLRLEDKLYPPSLYSGEYDFNHLVKKLPEGTLGLQPVVVIHPTVSWANRTLPEPFWEQVVNQLGQYDYKVVVIGSGNDHKLLNNKNCVKMTGKLTIHEVRELIKHASVFVGMDSGLLHIAQTTNTAIISIFTIADPSTRLFERMARTVSLVPKVPCKYCLHQVTPPVNYVECKYKTNACLKDFTPDQIVRSVADVTEF